MENQTIPTLPENGWQPSLRAKGGEVQTEGWQTSRGTRVAISLSLVKFEYTCMYIISTQRICIHNDTWWIATTSLQVIEIYIYMSRRVHLRLCVKMAYPRETLCFAWFRDMFFFFFRKCARFGALRNASIFLFFERNAVEERLQGSFRFSRSLSRFFVRCCSLQTQMIFFGGWRRCSARGVGSVGMFRSFLMAKKDDLWPVWKLIYTYFYTYICDPSRACCVGVGWGGAGKL